MSRHHPTIQPAIWRCLRLTRCALSIPTAPGVALAVRLDRFARVLTHAVQTTCRHLLRDTTSIPSYHRYHNTRTFAQLPTTCGQTAHRDATNSRARATRLDWRTGLAI